MRSVAQEYAQTGLSKFVLLAVIAWLVLQHANQTVYAQSTDSLITVEAENAALSGTETESELSGYSGSGYASQFNEDGDSITFDISVPEEDFYTLRFRFLNQGSKPAIRTMLLDGADVPETLEFRNVPDTFSPDRAGAWLTVDDSFHLAQGSHTVQLVFRESTSQGNVLIDQMQVLDETRPSAVSTRSLLMNNWQDLVGIHHSARLDQADDRLFGPRLAALHWAGDWPTNQIDGATAYFRDGETGQTFTNQHRFRSHLYFTDDGIMNVDYLGYGDAALPLDIKKRYAMVPNEPFLVASYSLTNHSDQPRSFSLMEMVDLNNPTAAGQGPAQEATATWYPDHNVWIADMTQTTGAYLVFGAFPLPGQSHQAGEAGSGEPTGAGSGILERFQIDSILENNPEIIEEDLLMAIGGNATVDAGTTQEFTFFYSVQSTLGEAMQAAQRARSMTADAWFEQTRNAWQQWLASGRASVDSGDPGVDQAYTRTLIALRQSQQPEFGSFVASTNPSYSYKVWPRDATVAALSLTAAGYFEQAEKFWMWMANVQEEGSGNVAGQQGVDDFPSGTWYTNYSYWAQDEPIDFVQPEWDSVGQFLIGVYHHWRLLNESNPQAAQGFLQSIYPAVVDSAQWIADNVGPNAPEEFGFGPPGYSVWEENFEYAVYTQVTYASGLNAARLLAEQMGETDRASEWLTDATTIRDNMLEPVDSEPCGGMWDDEAGYFIRGLFPPSSSDSSECEPHRVADASTDLIWVFGLLPVDDPKAQRHREYILNTLDPPYELSADAACISPEAVSERDWGYGISRYEGDTFYHTSEFSPGGRCESTVAMPSWPWMSSYMSMAEHWLGLDDLSFARLQWYVSVTGVGFMPTGEAVDWHTQQPLPSTMSQPDDSGYNMQVALLNYLNLFDPRLPPLDE